MCAALCQGAEFRWSSFSTDPAACHPDGNLTAAGVECFQWDVYGIGLTVRCLCAMCLWALQLTDRSMATDHSMMQGVKDHVSQFRR